MVMSYTVVMNSVVKGDVIMQCTPPQSATWPAARHRKKRGTQEEASMDRAGMSTAEESRSRGGGGGGEEKKEDARKEKERETETNEENERRRGRGRGRGVRRGGERNDEELVLR